MKQLFTGLCAFFLALSLSACSGQTAILSSPAAVSRPDSERSAAALGDTGNPCAPSSKSAAASQEDPSSAPTAEPPASPSGPPEELYIAPGAMHIDLYDDEDPFRDALGTTSVTEPAVTEQTQPADPVASQPEPAAEEQEATAMKMQVQVGGHAFSATLESNAATETLVEMMRAAPLEIQMRDYSGFEKVGSLGTSLPANDRQTTTQAGDIVLYTGNQIVMFYGSNSWSYTRLGRIDDLTGWEEALGAGNVTVTFSIN